MDIAISLRFLLLFILLLSVVFPATLQGVKMSLLTLVMGGGVICAVKTPSQMRWSKFILSLSLIFSVIGFFWSYYGEVRGNPGASRVLTVMAFYPLIFTIVGCFWKSGDTLKLQKTLLWFGLILVLSQGLYIASSFNIDGGIFYQAVQSLYGDVANIDQGDDYFLFTLPNVSSLIFMLPFAFIGLIFDSKYNLKYLLLLLSGIVVALLTGRRAIYLSFSLSVLFIFGLVCTGYLLRNRAVPKIKINKIVIICIVIAVFAVSLILIGLQNWDIVIDDIQSIFNFDSNSSNLERKYQFIALMEGIQQNLLFGSGAGAAATYARSIEQPWAYELSYLALLFHYGLLGFLVYTAGILYLTWWQIKLIFNDKIMYQSRMFILCYLSGFIALLIANATNPYLGKFDFMWVIFIPVMIINSFILTNEV